MFGPGLGRARSKGHALCVMRYALGRVILSEATVLIVMASVRLREMPY